MKDVAESKNAVRSIGVAGQAEPKEIDQCCLTTVEALSANNSMMVCSECKQIIKTFDNESAYRNYLLFCKGRSRVIQTGSYNGQRIVVYHSYDA